ncbi:MAG TPA: DUF177 domain-containing protein [Candidatus Enterenecus stercoripullorum]|nr:DUF177 domain-containing protein [Candidatus Enterenecus stercoripullorum]
MKLDLKRIASQPGQVLPFAFSLDLSQLEWNGMHPAPQPIAVEGSVRNMAGALLLQASLTGTLSLICDRCAKLFIRDKRVDYETLLAMELENGESDDIVLVDRDGQLDLDELMGDVFLLNLDTKNLCAEDCKGLCPGCGANLNEESCRCKKEVDPRLAKLAELLEGKD